MPWVHHINILAEPLPSCTVPAALFLSENFMLEPAAGLIQEADQALRLGGAGVEWAERNPVELIRMPMQPDAHARAYTADDSRPHVLDAGSAVMDTYEARTDVVRYTVCVSTILGLTTCKFCWLREATNRDIAEPRCERCAAEHDRQVRSLLIGIGVGFFAGVALAHVIWTVEDTPWYVAVLGAVIGALAGGFLGWRLAARRNDREVAALGEHTEAPPDDGRWIRIPLPDEDAEA